GEHAPPNDIIGGADMKEDCRVAEGTLLAMTPTRSMFFHIEQQLFSVVESLAMTITREVFFPIEQQ
ncbi:MAG: hypothetical protein WCK35_27095, partial [Chloroflexota bacterium]